MRQLWDFNPIVIFVYFMTVAGIAMFCLNPIILLLSLVGALLLFFIKNGKKQGRSHLFFVGLFLVMAVINPLVSHNGVTVLFVLNDAPFTAEALFYGMAASGMIVGVMYWFRSFTQIMTEDKLLYLFGKLSPRLALILSMGLRYVPLFGRQAKKIKATQTALGLYKDDNIIDRVKASLRVFSIMLTWALENGIITADSMSARGYGIGKRRHFSVFGFKKRDAVLLAVILALLALTCISLGGGAMEFTFYPSLKMAPFSPVGVMGYLSYGILVLLPAIIWAEEAIKWKYLRSKI